MDTMIPGAFIFRYWNWIIVQLFDRYGKLITVLNQNQTWDGTFNGHELPSTDYWFIVTRADGKEYKGHFTLKR
jgi:gliding motility-associated-like protein